MDNQPEEGEGEGLGNEMEAISERETPQLFISSSFYLFLGGQQIFVRFQNCSLVGEKIRAVLDAGRNCIHTFTLSHIHFHTFTSKLQPGWRKDKSSVGCGKKLY